MNKSESIKELATALAKAQSEIKGAKKDSANPFFKSKYADLTSVIQAIKEPLAKHGLSYIQLMQPSPKDQVAVETVLMHSSGEWISGVILLPVTKVDAQGHGSAITYARRYGLSAIVGLTAEDDDGNSAAGKNGQAEIAAPQQKPVIHEPKRFSPEPEGTATDKQKKMIFAKCAALKLTDDGRHTLLAKTVGKTSTKELDREDIEPLLDALDQYARGA